MRGGHLLSAVKRMAPEIVEVLADGLQIQPREVLLRVKQCPSCPAASELKTIGFGANTDPHIIIKATCKQID